MSTLLQVGLGLIPAALALITILILRKCFTVKSIIITLCSATVIGVMIFGSSTTNVTAKTSAMSKDEMLNLAYSLVEEEAWDSVDEIINEYSASFGYDAECTLICARSEAIKGDAQSAAAIYQKLVQMDSKYQEKLEDEISAVTAACAYHELDWVMISHINQLGKKPEDYGIDTNVDKKVVNNMVKSVKNIVSSECKERKTNKNIVKLAALIDDTEVLYEEYLASDISASINSDRTTSAVVETPEAIDFKKKALALVNEFTDIAEDYPEALTIYPIRMARLKACVLAENYSSIAAALDDYASYDELMIASELYMNDYLSQEDFVESWFTNDENKLNVVCEQIRKNMDSSALGEDERANAQKRIDILMDTANGGVLRMIKTRLNSTLNDNSISADKSKIYLQNSKIDRYLGNEDAATKNMLLAIDTAANSKDDNYSYPMCEISGIITGTSEAENIKNVATYVDRVIENSLTVQPSENIFIERRRTETTTKEVVTEENPGFAEFMEDKVTLCRAAVNIGMIDYSSFPEIKAKVQLASEFTESETYTESDIKVMDCYQLIDGFTLKKIDYSESNIMLVCDNSGSMGGSVGQLQAAVKSFIDSSNNDENISLIAFDGSIRAETPFVGSTDSQLQTVIDGMGAYGGTNIYGSILHGIEKFPFDAEANNVMIVMTDGQDGGSRDYETMQAEIGLAAENKGVTIYTIGLGSSVDASYLTNIASVGGGDFIYADDTDALANRYDLIHGQAKNQYLLEYTAYDTLTMNDRELVVTLADDERISDTKYYSMSDATEAGETKIELIEDLYIYGFDTRIIHKGEKDTVVKFTGAGFKKEDEITLTLDGSVDYPLATAYVDENTYSVTVPYGVAVDTYNLKITIGKNSAVLPNELYVVDDEQKSVTFGAYTFTANKVVTESDTSTLLTGMVTMNGWLRFNGDVTLSGDINNGYSIQLYETSGASVAFDPATAKGIAKSMADKGRTLSVGWLNGITLYKDPEHINNMEEYRVESYRGLLLKFYSKYTLTNTTIKLYPDRFVVDRANITTVLPFQDQIIKSETGKDLFSVDTEISFPINKNGIYCDIDVEYEDDGYFKGTKLFSGYVQLKEGAFHWSGLDDEISFNFLVKFNFTKEIAIGLTLGWKESYFDTALLHVDTEVPLNVSGVPVTLSDFSGGLKDLSEQKESMSWERLKNSTFVVGTQISVAKLSTYFKNMSEYFGDLSLVSTDDFELNWSLGRGYFSAKTDVMLLEEIKLAQAELEFGNISYTNAMLGLEDVAAKGARAYVKAGIMYDKLDGLEIDLSLDGELNLHSRFCGLKGGATGSLLLEWWLFDKRFDVSEDAIIGVYTDHYDRTQFVIGYSKTEHNKTSGRVVYIGADGLESKKL